MDPLPNKYMRRSPSPDFYGFDLSNESRLQQERIKSKDNHIRIKSNEKECNITKNYDNFQVAFQEHNRYSFQHTRNFFYELFKTTDELENWTGLKSFEVFKKILNKLRESKFEWGFKYKSSNIGVKIYIPLEELITIVLVRIKTNLNFNRMSTLFNMSKEEISSIFGIFVTILRSVLYTNKYWPSKRFGKSFCLILEPFEFYLDNCNAKIEDNFSVKAIVGIQQNGIVIWTSEIYSQDVTYNEICLREGIYEKLRRIDSVVLQNNMRVHKQFIKRGISCYTNEEKINSNVRNVRNFIRKEILSFEIFQNIRNQISESILHSLDDILAITCFIINMNL